MYPTVALLGFTVCLSQLLKFNYPQHVCTAVYGVGYSFSFFLLYTLGTINLEFCMTDFCVEHFHRNVPYRALHVTCQRLEACLSCCVECHHGNASLNQVTTTPNLIKALNNLFRRPQLQTKSFPISIDK